VIDDLRHVSAVFLKLQEDLERIRRSLRPSYVAFYDEIERALEPIRRQEAAFANTAAMSELASASVLEIVNANQHWQDLIDEATASRRMFSDLNAIHETWLHGLKPTQDQIGDVQIATKLSLGGLAYRLTVSEQLFSGLDLEAIRRAFALPELMMLKFHDAINDVTATYGKLADSMRTYQDITLLPACALPGATREVFVTGYALDVLDPSDQADAAQDALQRQLVTEVEEETSICVSLLLAVDPGLARPYKGARDALCGTNPDRTRHILSSLRELWNHLLRRIAPDEDVLAWAPKGENDLLHDGRPTRKARVLYVCRDLNHAPLKEFLVHDTRALVKMVELFNRVHELDSELTDEQLRALLLRTDSWLAYILKIWEGSR